MTRSRFLDLPIRHKLLLMVLLPLGGVLPVLLAVLLWWGNEAYDRLLLTKVQSDLAVAHGYFERVLAEVGASVGAAAESQALAATLARSADPQALLLAVAQRERLDFLVLLPAAAAGSDATSVEVLAPQALAALAPDLQARVAVPLLATRGAAPTARQVEDRAMVLLATRVVRDGSGQRIGVLQGGVLLNRNLDFIDHINEIVYPEGSLPFARWGSRGTATLFLDDVRISTNVRLFGADPAGRAIGTRVSHEVREAVMDRGNLWLDRAFVVSDWYVSGYRPLADGSGRRVGMLYVGILERPFALLKTAALASIAAVFIVVMVLAAWVSLRWARAIFRPLEQMEATIDAVEAGRMGARVGAVASGDEIGRLARHLDRLLGLIADNTQALQRWNAELDAKVAERTQALQQAQQQLLRSEKLATVGQLTASIAHEINNPIAVIQGNLDLLRELLGAEGQARVAPELHLVDAQIERMRLIVTQLLQYARPAEFAGYVEAVDTAGLLDECLALARHQVAVDRLRVERMLQATRQPAINRNELQQVLVNLIVNALQALQARSAGGTLRLASADVGADAVQIVVEDDGPGLPPALRSRLFQPFASGRAGGTGLGLWISRDLVERYGGDITAGAAQASATGARFVVKLRAGPEA